MLDKIYSWTKLHLQKIAIGHESLGNSCCRTKNAIWKVIQVTGNLEQKSKAKLNLVELERDLST